MGKWLDRVRGDSSRSLLAYQAAREQKNFSEMPEYRPDKTDKRGSVGFVGRVSAHFQKKEGPAKVWKSVIGDCQITVIDSHQSTLEEMRDYLVQKFGEHRVGEIREGGRHG